MLAIENMLEREGQSITHNQLGPLDDGLHPALFPRNKAAPGQTPNDVLRHDRLQQVPVAGAQSRQEFPGDSAFSFSVGIMNSICEGLVGSGKWRHGGEQRNESLD